jgi:hypothetical protein
MSNPRSGSGRSYIRPLGFESVPWVSSANIMISRVVLLMMLVCAMQSTFILEQPRGSLLRRHPRYVAFAHKQKLLKSPLFDLGINLGSFFAPSQKPLTLSSNNSMFLQRLWEHRPMKFLQRRAMLLRCDLWPALFMHACVITFVGIRNDANGFAVRSRLALVKKTIRKDGKHQVTGIKKALVSSQQHAYLCAWVFLCVLFGCECVVL